MNGHLHAPTAVLLGKETPLRLEYGVGGGQGQSGFLGDKDRFLPLTTNQTIPSPSHSLHRLRYPGPLTKLMLLILKSQMEKHFSKVKYKLVIEKRQRSTDTV